MKNSVADIVVYGKFLLLKAIRLSKLLQLRTANLFKSATKTALKNFLKKARDTGATSVFGFGWQFQKFEKNMPTRQQLDEICSDIPIYIAIAVTGQ